MSYKKNEGYKTIKTYSEIMTENKNVYVDAIPNFLNYFKYASITSVALNVFFH
jgi:hypothetical protein